MADPFIAEVRIFAGNFAPRGWAFCDGQLLPISQNTALFSLIGTTYGGDGRSTTALPNLQGRAPMHPGRGPGLTARRLGEKGGFETVTLTEAETPQHTHQLRSTDAATDEEGQKAPAGAATGEMQGSQQIYADYVEANRSAMAGEGLFSQGGSQSHQNMQPFLTLNFILSLQGSYPSRS